MREIRLHGSEGGGAQQSSLPLLERIKVPINDDGGSYATAYGTANVTAASTPAPWGAATTVSLDPLAPSWVMDEALASLGGLSRGRPRWARA